MSTAEEGLIVFRDAPRAVVHNQPASSFLHPRAGVAASGRASGVIVACVFPDPGTDGWLVANELRFVECPDISQK